MSIYEYSRWVYAGVVANVYGTIWYAQTFTPSESHNITSVVLALGRYGSPGTITVSIKATSGGVPTGIDLCSGTTNGNTLPILAWPTPAPEEREITFSTNPTLTAATVYAIVIRATSGNSSNKLYWQQVTENVYGDGNECWSAYSGSSWNTESNEEVWFEEYGEIVTYVDITGTITGTSSLSGVLVQGIRLDPPTVTYFYSTTGQYYYLLVQSDGTYGDPPGVGTENIDYVYLAAGYGPNFIKTTRKLVAVAKNTFYYEDI